MKELCDDDKFECILLLAKLRKITKSDQIYIDVSVPDIDDVEMVYLLNEHFKDQIFYFKKTKEFTTELNTVKIALKDNTYLRDNMLSFTDTFDEELCFILNCLGIKYTFNNTRTVFWW